MYIAICDDDKLSRDAIADSVNRWQTLNVDVTVSLSHYSSTEDLLEKIRTENIFDIVFLDIQIPGELSGLELARHIRSANDTVAIVFITNHSEYACAGYKVNALRYIPKPIQYGQIAECLDIVNAQCQTVGKDAILLRGYDRQLVVHHRNVIFMQASGHYLQIHETKDKAPLKVRMTIKDILRCLPNNMFVQCHRCYAVNIMYARKLTRTEITMSNGMNIPIGKKYSESVGSVFLRFYQGATQ